jgi:hypothetical protein
MSIIAQPYFHELFSEIHIQVKNRLIPEWIGTNVVRGMYLTLFEYQPQNEFAKWDDIFFINDRYHNRSFTGAIGELAWLLSLTDTELSYALPCLTKDEQVNEALDFYVGNLAYQLKTVELGSYDDLQVQYDYLDTSADYLVLLDPVSAKSYTLSPQQWRSLKKSQYHDDARQMFWVHPDTVSAMEGEIQDLPQFIKRSRHPK